MYLYTLSHYKLNVKHVNKSNNEFKKIEILLITNILKDNFENKKYFMKQFIFILFFKSNILCKY